MEDSQMTTKKALFIVGLLFFILGLGFVIPAKWVPTDTKRKNYTPLLLRDPQEFAVLSEDKNNNKTPDWKDLLLTSLPESSKEELKKEPISQENFEHLQDPNNLTASFSKSAYTLTAYAEKNGVITDTRKKEILTSLITAETQKIKTITYTTDNLKKIVEDSPSSKKAYGNAFAIIVKKGQGYDFLYGDMETVKKFTQDKDASGLASLITKKKKASSLLEELLTTPVPRTAIPYHLLAVNRLSEYIAILDALSQADSDPLKATLAFKDYEVLVKSFASTILSIQNYLLGEGVTYTKNEPGYMFTLGYTKQ